MNNYNRPNLPTIQLSAGASANDNKASLLLASLNMGMDVAISFSTCKVQ